MDMEKPTGGGGEFSIGDHSVVIKGKRSKRRPCSWTNCAAATRIAEITSSYSNGGDIGGIGSNGFSIDRQSPSTSTTVLLSEEEEEKLIRCLMLLAKGINPAARRQSNDDLHHSSRKFVNIAPARKGEYPISHKKPKLASEEIKARNPPAGEGGYPISHKKKPKLTPAEITARNPPSAGEGEKARIDSAAGKGKAKLHECSICGVTFSSGQALGGHKTRHRPAMMPPPAAMNHSTNCFPPISLMTKNNDSTEDVVENRGKRLLFDVNCLAVEDDDHRNSNSELASTSRIIVYPASDMV